MRWKNPVTDIPNAIKNASAKAIISNITGRDSAKTTISILKANRPCAEHYRPYFFRRILYSSFSIRPFCSMDLSCLRRFSSSGIL